MARVIIVRHDNLISTGKKILNAGRQDKQGYKNTIAALNLKWEGGRVNKLTR